MPFAGHFETAATLQRIAGELEQLTVYAPVTRLGMQRLSDAIDLVRRVELAKTDAEIAP